MKINAVCSRVYVCVSSALHNRGDAVLGLVGVCVLVSGLSAFSHAQTQFDDNQIQCALVQLYTLMNGAFGALIMVVAGIGAIIASAFGAYKSGMSMLVVALGSFILQSLVSLFFGAYGSDPACSGSAGTVTIPSLLGL